MPSHHQNSFTSSSVKRNKERHNIIKAMQTVRKGVHHLVVRTWGCLQITCNSEVSKEAANGLSLATLPQMSKTDEKLVFLKERHLP